MFKYIKDYVYTPPRAYILNGGGEGKVRDVREIYIIVPPQKNRKLDKY